MNRLARLLAAVVATIALTSGCSMIPGLGGSQSGIQACASIGSTIQDAATKLTSALTQAASDPKAAGKAVQEFVDSLSAARTKVTNANVGAALDKAISSGNQLVDLLSKADASSLDSDKASALAEQVQTALTDLVTACTKG
jgi:hypothetical protein